MQSECSSKFLVLKIFSNYIFFKKQMAAILYLSLTKIVWNLKTHITSKFIYRHIRIEKPGPKCGYI